MEEPDEDEEQDRIMGDVCDVTTLFGQSEHKIMTVESNLSLAAEVKTIHDSKEGIVAIKQEPVDTLPQQGPAPLLDLFQYYRLQLL